MERELISFMFVGGCLLFLFGAMILGKIIMYVFSLLWFIIAVFFVVYDFKTKTQRGR